MQGEHREQECLQQPCPHGHETLGTGHEETSHGTPGMALPAVPSPRTSVVLICRISQLWPFSL